jgi:apolipoprotein N-acyltransferase
VALVQGNIPQQLKWSPQHRQQIIEHYLSLSAPLLNNIPNSGNQLIVWPETAIPLLYDIALPRLASFEQTLQQTQTGLISGIPYRTPATAANPVRFHNSIMGLGTAEGLYHKQRLVPFGEYVPLESWLRGLIDFFNLPMSSFSLGPANQPPLLLQQRQHPGNPIRISAYICYEIVYPDLVASTARNSDLLLTISNDSWFGDSLAPQQHLQMARMRALENGRFLIRSTNNGISALINARGEITHQGSQFVVDIVQGEVLAMTGTTPFGRWGSMPILILCMALIVITVRSGRHNNVSKTR